MIIEKNENHDRKWLSFSDGNEIISPVVYSDKRFRVAKPRRSIDRSTTMTRSTPRRMQNHHVSSWIDISWIYSGLWNDSIASRNTALQPIFVELPRFVNDKRFSRETILSAADELSYGCCGEEWFLSRRNEFRELETLSSFDTNLGNETLESSGVRDFAYIPDLQRHCLI